MEFQSWINNLGGLTSVYSFDIMPDGSYSEIRFMAMNNNNAALLSRNPNAPKFYPGIPWRSYFTDINMENFCYRCGSTGQPLYSYVNAHGYWLKGFYIPLFEEGEKQPPDSPRTAHVLYILNTSKDIDPDAMAHRSAETSSAVINISIKLHETQNFVQAMSETVSELKKVCGSEMCAIITVDKNTGDCAFYNEYGVQEELMRNISRSMERSPFEMAQAWEKDLMGSDCMLLSDLEVLKERDPLWYESLRNFGINSVVLYSVRFGQNVVGFIWAANFNDEKVMQIKEILELTVFFIGSAIANHQLMSQLEIKSSTDVLTQVGSRNSMNERIEELSSGEMILPETLGVVYADLNGLKVVNDTLGHSAGDRVLSRAASLLKLAFGEHEIYRAGGDEFVILCSDITEEELERKTAQLRALADATEDVSFAVGTVWFSEEYDIDRALQIADARMYEDKEEYYRLHPKKERRR